MTPDLIRRQEAVNRTLKKFRSKPHDWKKGHTCVHLARFHLRQMNRRAPKLPPVTSLLAARRALAERGWADCTAMLDSLASIRRIAPAMMLMGDLAVVPGMDGLGAIVLCLGPQKLAGWREDHPAMVVLDTTFDVIEASWRL